MEARRAALRLSGAGAGQLWRAATAATQSAAPASVAVSGPSTPGVMAPSAEAPAAAGSSRESTHPAGAGSSIHAPEVAPTAAAWYRSLACASTGHAGCHWQQVLQGRLRAHYHTASPHTLLKGAHTRIASPHTPHAAASPAHTSGEAARRSCRGLSGNAASAGDGSAAGLSTALEFHRRAEDTLHHLHEELDVSPCPCPCLCRRNVCGE